MASMTCSVCQHEMVKSKAGWLCLNCGHTELADPLGDMTIRREKGAVVTPSGTPAADADGANAVPISGLTPVPTPISAL